MANFDFKKFQALQKQAIKRYDNEASLLCGEDQIPTVDVIPIGDPVLDELLSGGTDKGGIIRGGVNEIAGGYSSGKTTLALEWLAAFSKQFPERGIMFIDVEKAMDKDYARHIGVPVDEARFVYSSPKNGQEAVTIARDMMRSGMFSCIVIDSWAALEPPRQADAEVVGNHGIGDLARLTGDALRAFKSAAADNDTTMIILNQERVNMTAMGARGKKTTGGNAMTYYPDMRLSINRTSKESDERIIKVVKSKCQALPFTSCAVTIKHNVGLDRFESLFNLAIEKGHILKGGAWFTMPFLEDAKVQGRANLFEFFSSDQEAFHKLCKEMNVTPFEPRPPLIRKTIGKIDDDDSEEITPEE